MPLLYTWEKICRNKEENKHKAYLKFNSIFSISGKTGKPKKKKKKNPNNKNTDDIKSIIIQCDLVNI